MVGTSNLGSSNAHGWLAWHMVDGMVMFFGIHFGLLNLGNFWKLGSMGVDETSVMSSGV